MWKTVLVICLLLLTGLSGCDERLSSYKVAGLFPAEAAYVAAVLHLEAIGKIEGEMHLSILRDISPANDTPVLSEVGQQLLRSELDVPNVEFLSRVMTSEEIHELDGTYIAVLDVLGARDRPEGAEAAFELESVRGPEGQVSGVYSVIVDVEDGIATILRFEQTGVSLERPTFPRPMFRAARIGVLPASSCPCY